MVGPIESTVTDEEMRRDVRALPRIAGLASAGLAIVFVALALLLPTSWTILAGAAGVCAGVSAWFLLIRRSA